MAARAHGGTPARKGRSQPTRRGGTAPTPKARSKQASTPKPPPPPAGPFRLGAIAGATPGKWIDVWQQRMPRTPLELVPLEVADQRAALDDDIVDAALVRLPIDRDDLHVIALYDEVAVVVCAADSHLTAADELTLADLAGEVVITPADAAITVAVPDAVAPRFTPPETTADAIATAATGVGVVVVPMSLARLHHRKDTEWRPLADGPLSPVALVWPAERTTELVETFVGIVRGRSANSSRA
ncbi:substrate-binding domain-containing protein [Microbacterium sp. W1N]|uniref:substrate-binding domain-containing protein n=1 Tax=Microbacterium festucae TaxID=2977531 RepID=UPI0021BF3395|nr:substrate-binding domain-containing protein [Microbacterium festucae]MCT9819142.1 substrate-binding domain-containing protein [Microbacterium festucae]